MEAHNAEALMRAYLRLRDKIEDEKAAHAVSLAPLESQFDAVSTALLGLCNELGVDSLRSSVGTLTRRVSTRYWCSDWEAMRKFILEQKAVDLLEQRVHSGNMREFIEANPDTQPPGLRADSTYKVQIRRATPRTTEDE